METRFCGWNGCDVTVDKINQRTNKPFYYCDHHMRTRKSHKKTHYMKTKNKHNEDMLARYHGLRRDVFELYGNVCNCCGESEYVFLALDHVQGGGTQHRKERGGNYGVYVDALKTHDPDRFQILCHNCNMAKHTLGICPHQLASLEK